MLKKTSLAELHVELGGKIVDFGGWAMPLHYGSQVQEHHIVRQSAGMFDVSHMTVVDVAGEEAQAFLRYLLANDVAKLKEQGKALYSGMLNEQGGVIDDLIVYLVPWGYRLVVNCATREQDLAWMKKQAAAFNVEITEKSDLSIIAVQGPQALEKVGQILPVLDDINLSVFQGEFICPLMACVALPEDAEGAWFFARTGYTGEQGYEIILPSADAEGLWRSLLAVGVEPCGLGARDTLRLEAGMNLYGHEMNENISPLAANMDWCVAWEPSERDFIGRKALESQKALNNQDKLVGLILSDKGVLRAEQVVTCEGVEGEGIITSGSFSPTLGKSIALARVPLQFEGKPCRVQVRKKHLSVDLVKPNFVRHGKAV